MKLSVVVLTQNSAATLAATLESIKKAEEIIVVDGGSTDGTLKIAQKYTDKIFTHHLTSFADQRNWAAKNISGDWLFYLDADEQVTAKGWQEIRNVATLEHSAWRFKRQNIFFGHRMRYSGYWPDWQTRLFKVSDFKGVVGAVHEQFKFAGSLGSMAELIKHTPPRNMSANLVKSAHWTRMEAEALFKAGHPPITALRLIKVMVWEFCFRYFKKLGFLDGYLGFEEAVFQAMNKFFVYQQVWEMQQK